MCPPALPPDPEGDPPGGPSRRHVWGSSGESPRDPLSPRPQAKPGKPRTASRPPAKAGRSSKTLSYPDGRDFGLLFGGLWLFWVNTLNCVTKGLTVLQPRLLLGERGGGGLLEALPLLLLLRPQRQAGNSVWGCCRRRHSHHLVHFAQDPGHLRGHLGRGRGPTALAFVGGGISLSLLDRRGLRRGRRRGLWGRGGGLRFTQLVPVPAAPAAERAPLELPVRLVGGGSAGCPGGAFWGGGYGPVLCFAGRRVRLSRGQAQPARGVERSQRAADPTDPGVCVCLCVLTWPL